MLYMSVNRDRGEEREEGWGGSREGMGGKRGKVSVGEVFAIAQRIVIYWLLTLLTFIAIIHPNLTIEKTNIISFCSFTANWYILPLSKRSNLFFLGWCAFCIDMYFYLLKAWSCTYAHANLKMFRGYHFWTAFHKGRNGRVRDGSSGRMREGGDRGWEEGKRWKVWVKGEVYSNFSEDRRPKITWSAYVSRAKADID